MAKRVAIINMKGGVGKSTITVNLAWHLYLSGGWPLKRKILVVDLDPQFNASQYLLGSSKYRDEVVTKNRPTIWNIFEERSRMPGHEEPVSVKPEDAIVSVDSSSNSGARLDLLPSRLELAWSLKQPAGKEKLLDSFLDRVENQYDLILIDCAPTESMLTSAAYHAAPNVFVPVKPEFLSTIGLPLLAKSIEDHNNEPESRKTSVIGIVFNHASDYLPEEALSKKEVWAVAENFKWRVFTSEVPFSRSFPKGAREGKPLIWTSNARENKKTKIFVFAAEFARVIGL
ncbi:MAG: ParA family protein [Candidatus Sumerlaeota bacterium]|nr:ParA family protein [Candidatus Sumerlaeota bacterium]